MENPSLTARPQLARAASKLARHALRLLLRGGHRLIIEDHPGDIIGGLGLGAMAAPLLVSVTGTGFLAIKEAVVWAALAAFVSYAAIRAERHLLGGLTWPLIAVCAAFASEWKVLWIAGAISLGPLFFFWMGASIRRDDKFGPRPFSARDEKWSTLKRKSYHWIKEGADGLPYEHAQPFGGHSSPTAVAEQAVVEKSPPISDPLEHLISIDDLHVAEPSRPRAANLTCVRCPRSVSAADGEGKYWTSEIRDGQLVFLCPDCRNRG